MNITPLASIAVLLGAATGSPAAYAHPEHLWGEHLWSLCLAGVTLVTPDAVWQAWSLAPVVVIPLLALLLGYRRGHRALRRQHPQRVIELRRCRDWFVGGWLLLAVALISPLCRLSATLVAAHMVQLMLLVVAATALLALGRTGQVLAAAMPRRWLTAPLALHVLGKSRSSALGLLTLGYGGLIWLWHAPPVYTAIQTVALWHWLAFATLITVSTWFWARIIAAHRDHAGAALAALLTTMMHTGLLGALLTFSSRPLYPVLAEGARAWQLQPIHDQQLAGLIMWVGGGTLYLLAALALCAMWLRDREPVGAIS
ncbi:MAG: cytochrome c oxidase assembly protein [Pseudomonadales bacterium]